MNFTGNNLHQGDTQWFELQQLPSDLKKVEELTSTERGEGGFGSTNKASDTLIH